jgi:Holliday junction resolvase RusA-like endonuclease
VTVELRFVVEGKPVPAARPRFDPRTRRSYTDPRSREYQRTVRGEAWAAALRERVDGRLLPRSPTWPREENCGRARFRRRGAPAPKCNCEWCSRRYELELLIALPDRRTRDLDNIEKAILDGCTGALWRDDRQAFVKMKSPVISPERPRVEVLVRVCAGAQLELAQASGR